MKQIDKLKIPTLLGLSVIFIGMFAAVFLVMRQQSLTTQAAPDQIPQDITFTNIEDISLTISWRTSALVTSFISYGQSSFSDTALDDRDDKTPKPRLTHHFTLKNLLPQTTYKFKLTSGKLIYPKVLTFTTASAISNQNGLKPVQGLGVEGDQTVADGIVYLLVQGAVVQSAPIKDLGNFIIPLNKIRKEDLQDVFLPDQNTTFKLRMITSTGEASAVFHLKDLNNPIGPLKIGQNLDLTIATPSAIVTPKEEPLKNYDLNADGVVNTSDYSIVRKNFGQNPKDKKADLNSDGVVDQKDLDLISQFLKSRK